MTPEQLHTLLTRAATPQMRAWLHNRKPAVVPVLAAWLRDLQAAAVQACSPICEPEAPMYDSMGRRYLVRYQIAAVSTDGSGPIYASNIPGSFQHNKHFPIEFQARDLSTIQEMQKIRTIARNLDPDRLLRPHSDPTLGAPVIWTAPDGDGFVLGGNGRTLAILMADPEKYAEYAHELRRLWGSLPAPTLRPGQRAILVRDVFRADGKALSVQDAVQLAGASQESTAAAESPIGRALSVLRGMGLSDPRVLPPFVWSGPINSDTMATFEQENGPFWEAVLERVDPGKRAAYSGNYHAAELARQIMVGYLPPEVQRGGFEDTRTEDALMAVLPLIVGLHTRVRSGEIKPRWDLLPVIGEAYAVYRILAKLRATRGQAVPLLAKEALQTTLAETTLSSVSLLGYYLGWALYLASGRKNPEDFVTVFQPYLAAAVHESRAVSDLPLARPVEDVGVGLFGGARKATGEYVSIPSKKLATELGLAYPEPHQIAPTVRQNPRGRR